MRPLVRSYGESSMVTRSPARTRMRLRRSLPARWASTVRSWSSWTLNRPLGNFSTTVPVTSILSSLLIFLAEDEVSEKYLIRKSEREWVIGPCVEQRLVGELERKYTALKIDRL